MKKNGLASHKLSAIGSWDGRMRLWDALTGKELCSKHAV
jgi:hypothetical protein